MIDLDGDKTDLLRETIGQRTDVNIYPGDCNEILLNQVFARCRWGDYARALCILDPYGLDLGWKVLETAGSMKSIEIFFNFMIMDANRNVLWQNAAQVSEVEKKRLDFVWGDRSWEGIMYKREQLGLFDAEPIAEKVSKANEKLAEAFRKRLKEVAGFKYVPEPIPLRNTKGATIYYLYFASPNPTGNKIITQIFDKYRSWGTQ